MIEFEKTAVVYGKVDKTKRLATQANHTATHIMQAALRTVLGDHVKQSGSLVNAEKLRFDFSHYQKLEKEEIANIESIVNNEIRKNTPLDEHRSIPITEALDRGAIAFFGEKYGDHVRMIRFGESIELCGGTHVSATGNIGYFKIISESAIAAGIRRIEAITGEGAGAYITKQSNAIDELKMLLKSPDVLKGVQSLIDHQSDLLNKLDLLEREKLLVLRKDLLSRVEQIGGINFIGAKVNLNAAMMKNLSFDLKTDLENLFLILGSEDNGKASLAVMISDSLIKDRDLNASVIVRELAKEIQGGGGGQPHYATAGGKRPSGLESAIEKVKNLLSS